MKPETKLDRVPAGSNKLRTYDNSFDVGVVLLRFTGTGAFCAVKHTTTIINNPFDPGEINHENIALRTVAHTTAMPNGSTNAKCSSTASFLSKESVGYSQHRKSRFSTQV